MMKITIIGLGAMGSIYAALFAAAGYEVIAYDPWVEHIDAINKKGLSIESPSGTYTIKNIKSSSVFEAHKDCDLYIIATKASDVGLRRYLHYWGQMLLWLPFRMV